MPTNERLVDAAAPLAKALVRPEEVRRSHELERLLRQLLEGRDFVHIKSPDGATWRLRVDNAGTLTTSKVTP